MTDLGERHYWYSFILLLGAVATYCAGLHDLAILNTLGAIWMKMK